MQHLDHNGIVKYHNYGYGGMIIDPQGPPIDNLVFIVMEYVNG